MLTKPDIDIYMQENKPQSLDAAYERKAMEQGLVQTPVFKENNGWGQPLPKESPFPALWPLVQVDMQTRDSFGAYKYNTQLKAFNGRDALKDAYEEALDLVVYLRQVLFERDGK